MKQIFVLNEDEIKMLEHIQDEIHGFFCSAITCPFHPELENVSGTCENCPYDNISDKAFSLCADIESLIKTCKE